MKGYRRPRHKPNIGDGNTLNNKLSGTFCQRTHNCRELEMSASAQCLLSEYMHSPETVSTIVYK